MHTLLIPEPLLVVRTVRRLRRKRFPDGVPYWLSGPVGLLNYVSLIKILPTILIYREQNWTIATKLSVKKTRKIIITASVATGMRTLKKIRNRL